MAPPALIEANQTTGEYDFNVQSWLIRDETITQVREYSYLEYTCNNTAHVSGNTSTFQIQCPPSGQFPTVYEYPVLGPDGNYSQDIGSPVLDDTRKIINQVTDSNSINNASSFIFFNQTSICRDKFTDSGMNSRCRRSTM